MASGSKWPFPESDSLRDLVDEMARARDRFPNASKNFLALIEEVGELGTALLEIEGRGRIKAEALQVACVAMRIYEEGDPTIEGANFSEMQPLPGPERVDL